MSLPIVVALDPSLTGFGMATTGRAFTFKPPKGLDGIQRLRCLRDEVAAAWGSLHGAPLYIVMEGPAYGTQGTKAQAGHHERAGLWWMIREAVDLRDLPITIVPPTSLKKYATGKGNAPKDEVLIQAVQRLPIQVLNNNEADAAVMYAMAMDHLGSPIAAMPAKHREALQAVQWAVQP